MITSDGVAPQTSILRGVCGTVTDPQSPLRYAEETYCGAIGATYSYEIILFNPCLLPPFILVLSSCVYRELMLHSPALQTAIISAMQYASLVLHCEHVIF